MLRKLTPWFIVAFGCLAPPTGEPPSAGVAAPSPERRPTRRAPRPGELPGVAGRVRLRNDLVPVAGPFAVGAISAEIEDARLISEIGGNQYSRTVAMDGTRFLIVHLRIRNDADHPVAFGGSVNVVWNGTTSRLAPDARLSRALQAWAQRQVNLPEVLTPGQWYPASFGFEVPDSIEHPVLRFEVGDARVDFVVERSAAR